MVCEVISMPSEADRWRMLVEAIAAVRIGHYLKKSQTKPFFVVAVYLRANMTAERYVVMQTDSDGKVWS